MNQFNAIHYPILNHSRMILYCIYYCTWVTIENDPKLQLIQNMVTQVHI